MAVETDHRIDVLRVRDASNPHPRTATAIRE
jgi:hypothetical protein